LAKVLLPCAALAQSGPVALEQRTWFGLQAVAASIRSSSFYESYNTNQLARLQNEDDLGVARRKAVAGLAFGRRIGERWRVEVDYLGVRRNAAATLRRDIDIYGLTYPAGSTTQAEVFVNAWRVSAGWSFIMNADAEWGVLIGGQNVHMSNHLDGSASAGAGAAPSPVHRDLSNNATVPAVGLYGQLALAQAWTLAGHLDVALREKYTNLVVNGVWRMTPNVGLGLGWRYTDSRFDITTVFIGTSRDVLSYRASGPQLNLTVSF
jgi:hypothetical protein